MSIPPIGPYAMPDATAAGPAVAPWRPDPARAALLVHDAQRYFLAPFPPDASPGRELRRNLARLRDTADATGVPVFYSMQPGDMTTEERGLLRDFWRQGMRAVPEHRDIVPEAAPRPHHRTVVKWRYSAFHRTDLAELLAAAGRDQLIVCGVYAHLGCLITAYDAFSRDLETFLVADALGDFSGDHHRTALRTAAASCAVVLNTAEIATHLGRTGTSSAAATAAAADTGRK
ncbi:isochorismatase family protein [Catenuloplanes atrovinosus]|uniref:Bifunctional isochorismate lyase/aryl carrier protein n=1 Tax=Catenuloplanes atrovinosus TaxID=137266 RepID=A0AAE3YH84_9ACTN|nr:isochorismatase family protein [Catenuloplanes atrovinosus]MDR7273619.1 bifunctional isochorismate lyase/aryl carrier protein [Catenuloplanes atrovinosus]